MKRTELIKQIEKEVLSHDPRKQAKIINGMEKEYMFSIISFLYYEGKKEFLRFLSIVSLIEIVKVLFMAEYDGQYDETESSDTSETSIKLTKEAKFLKEIINLPLFSKVWEGVQDITPTKMFCLIPTKLIRKTLFKNLLLSDLGLKYQEVWSVVENGSYANKVLRVITDGNLEKKTEKKYEKLEKEYFDLVPEKETVGYGWIISLLEVLPSDQKLSKLYSNSVSTKYIDKLISICATRAYHISDDRDNPLPYALSLLSYDNEMSSGDYAYNEHVEKAVQRASDEFSELLKTYCEKLKLERLILILNFFCSFTYKDEQRKDVIQKLPLNIVDKLISSRKCKWIKSYLSTDQKIALRRGSSISAFDVKKILSEDDTKPLSRVSTEKVQRLSLEEKMLFVSIN